MIAPPVGSFYASAVFVTIRGVLQQICFGPTETFGCHVRHRYRCKEEPFFTTRHGFCKLTECSAGLDFGNTPLPGCQVGSGVGKRCRLRLSEIINFLDGD
jgi:hypothetical protein